MRTNVRMGDGKLRLDHAPSKRTFRGNVNSPRWPSDRKFIVPKLRSSKGFPFTPTHSPALFRLEHGFSADDGAQHFRIENHFRRTLRDIAIEHHKICQHAG